MEFHIASATTMEKKDKRKEGRRKIRGMNRIKFCKKYQKLPLMKEHYIPGEIEPNDVKNLDKNLKFLENYSILIKLSQNSEQSVHFVGCFMKIFQIIR